MAPRRVLIAGRCEGRLDELLKRVEAVCAKSGAFDLLVCLGERKPWNQTEGGTEGELAVFVKAGNRAPIPTYFIGSRADADLVGEHPESNLHCVGQHGVTKIHGLTIAYAGGDLDGGPKFKDAMNLMSFQASSLEGDVDLLITESWPRGIAGLIPDGQVGPGAKSMSDRGSTGASQLAELFRPRYHVSAAPLGQPGCFYARQPYKNADLGTGSHVTRFIALAAVGNTAKQKFLHALGLQPASEMTKEAFLLCPKDATASPYAVARERGVKRPAGSAGGSGAASAGGEESWRWGAGVGRKRHQGMPQGERERYGAKGVVRDGRKSAFVRNLPFSAGYDNLVEFFKPAGVVVDIRRRMDDSGRPMGWAQVQFGSVAEMQAACSLNETELMGRVVYVKPSDAEERQAANKPNNPIADCWFCLSNANADVDLVTSVGTEVYCALDKGPLSPFHLLVVPIDHIANVLEIGQACFDEVTRYLAALKTCFKVQGLEMVCFERFLRLKGREGGNHMQLNVVGVPQERAGSVKETVDAAAQNFGFRFKAVTSSLPEPGEAGFRDKLRDMVGDMEYILVVLPDGSQVAHPIMMGERIPFNFTREVVAAAMGCPERGDWKACKMSAQEEVEKATRFKALFAPYDIMNG